MNNIELRQEIYNILDNIDNIRYALNQIIRIKDRLVNLTINQIISEQEFYRITSVLTPQSRSPLWQNYFIHKYNCEKIASKKDRGDLKKNGIYYEYKASGYNLSNQLNIKQIRLWQNCDYIIQHISDLDIATFILTHNNMVLECDILKASPIHGTKTALLNNQNIELGFSIDIESNDWYRWISKYCNDNKDFPI